MAEIPDLKGRTVHSVKWNVFDKLSTQGLYAITGIILANLISPEEFGLVGAVLVFQAFAALFVDSGFASALIQRKEPTEQDYSTIFWFNIIIAIGIYAILWFSAPLIDLWFHGQGRLIWLARASFLTVILNATGIVQTNRMVKQMTMRPVAIANCLGLLIGGIIGIYLAIQRADAWALVWQQVITAGAKSAILWIMVRWTPMMVCSRQIIRSFFAVGSGVMFQSLLNVIFQNIYSFFIGNRLGFISLGNYTQADKWSKMGSAALSAILTSSFLPALSAVQDQPERFARFVKKMHRSTAALLFISFGWMIIVAEPLFHALLGHKWDAAIPLFQLLVARGIFTVLTSLYCNFILAVGKSKLLVKNEILRNAGSLIALVATMQFWHESNGLEIMIWGQIIAAAITFVATVAMTATVTYRSIEAYLLDLAPMLAWAIIPLALSVIVVTNISNPWIAIGVSVISVLVYPPIYRLRNI